MRTFTFYLLICCITSIAPIVAQTSQECFDCHDDPDLSTLRGGREVSLSVVPAAFSKSIHGDLECVDCHVGFDPEEEPHRPRITPVNCAECHEEAENVFKHSKHSSELTCTSCHGNLHQKKHPATESCIGCHKEASEQLRGSIHFGKENSPTCYQCHAPDGAKWVTSQNCLSCHGEKTFPAHEGSENLYDFVMQYNQSIHGESIECSDCHGGHDIFPADSAQSMVHRSNLLNTCGACHEDIAADYRQSEHGSAYLEGFAEAPSCVDCHGEHDILQLTDSRSPVSRQHEVEVCLKCHEDTPEVTSRMTHTAGFIGGYKGSIHGREHAKGNWDAAVCSDCHGGHTEMKASNPASKIYKFNITSTCQQCHEEISVAFSSSVHGEALSNGVEESPTCTNCHGEHDILEHTLQASPVAPQNVSAEVCGPCHASVKLASKFGISSDRFQAFDDSYHGLAVKFGNVEVANCASCHGVHNILPSADPQSMIYPDNLAQTCGECHPGANENFSKGKVHVSVRSAQSDKILYWIAAIYLFIIVGTIGGMLIHNVLDWYRKAKIHYQQRYQSEGVKLHHSSPKAYVRMTGNERVQHILLFTSFFTLVITGFMLKFPTAWWVDWLREWGGGFLYEFRYWVHRIAAILMTLTSFYHIYYLIFKERGRQFIKDMRFNLQDLKDMVQMLRFNLGLSQERPLFDRFNYIEKSEYWALVWGTVVMTVTGFALWFENQSMAWFSKLFLDICEVVHYYEAWLAFLAIIVWHLYYVIFNPDVYPMNFTWITGKLTEEEMEHEHPLELQRIKSEAGSDDSQANAIEDMEQMLSD